MTSPSSARSLLLSEFGSRTNAGSTFSFGKKDVGSNGHAEEIPWVGTQVQDIEIDVQRMPQVRAQHPDLDIGKCCDRNATAAVMKLCSCCAICVVLPILGFTIMRKQVSGIALDINMVVSCVLLAAGILLCCKKLLPVVVVSVNAPPPADLVYPLVRMEENPTHRECAVHRLALVYNPHAGKGKAQELLQDVILPHCRTANVEVVEVPTTHVGHARELGIDHDFTGLDVVVAMGGDGTLHELANGLLARSSSAPPLGLIPMGSGNAVAADFRQSQRHNGAEVSIYKELETSVDWAIERILEGKNCGVDILEVTTKGKRIACVSMLFFGIMAEIDLFAEPLRWMGPARFDLTAIWLMLRKKRMPVCHIDFLSPEGQWQRVTNDPLEGGCPWFGLALDLGQHWSDTMRASPTSRLDDGIAELQILRCDASVTDLLKGFILLPIGGHVAFPGMERVFNTIPFVELVMTFPGLAEGDGSKEGLFNLDGEIFCHDSTIRVKVLKNKLQVCCDPNEECYKPDVPFSPAASLPGTPGVIIEAGVSQSSFTKVYGERWLMLVIFCSCNMASQIAWISFSPIAQTVSTFFHVSDSFINMLSLVFMILYIPLTIPASYFIDRLGCRPALLSGIFLTALGAGIRILAVTFNTGKPGVNCGAWLLLGGQAVAALGQPFLTNMPPKLAHAWFPKYQLMMADTIASVSAQVGAAIGFLVPAAITQGKGELIQNLLVMEACLFGFLFLVALTFFQSTPPTPPTATTPVVTPITTPGTGRSPIASPLVGLEAHQPAEEQKGVIAEYCQALKDRDFRALLGAFACALGSFNVLATLLAQLTTPFGFKQDIASNFGAMVIVMGLIGAVLCSIWLGYNGSFRRVLLSCFGGATIAACAFATLAPLGPQYTGLMYAVVSLLGMTLTPVMPLSFEASVELMTPEIGEAVLSGLFMSASQVVGITMTIVLQTLLARKKASLVIWVLSCGIALGSVSFCWFRDKSLGSRKRKAQAVRRASARSA